MNLLFSSSCFIGEPGVFFGAFLGPIFAILLLNAVMFFTVISVLIQKSLWKKFASKDQVNRQSVFRLMTSIVGVMALFGLTWIFGALTVREASTAFQFLFAIFNSLQGFFIFLFFCVFGREGQKHWLRVLCCGRKIPGITVPKQKSVKQSRTSSSRPSEHPTNGLRAGPMARILNTSSAPCRLSVQSVGESETSWVISTVETTPAPFQQSQVDELRSVKVNQIAAEELEIIINDQRKKESLPPTVEVPCQNAAHLLVIVDCSSTVYHDTRIAESGAGGDNESDT